MTTQTLCALADLIDERDPLLAVWRVQVRQLPGARLLDVPTINDHIPLFLEELAIALRSEPDQPIPHSLVWEGALAHGAQRVKDSFDIQEVVAEYSMLRSCIHDLADQNGLNLQGQPFHILNRVFDGAIGSAVQAFAVQKALEVQHRREDYLSFVAHDLRTPLSAAALSAELLQLILLRHSLDIPQVSSMLRTLDRNINHMKQLVNKVLEENSNLETELGMKLERRKLDLWPLVESLIHDLRPVAGTASTVLINNIPDDLVVYADAGLLRRVFQNLIANAIDYTPLGEITISALESSDKTFVECMVSDNGKGISAERCETIFNKHETDSEKDGGLGLGLAIVKTFVEAHDGVVSVDSKIGVGSTFRFTLPNK